ncbi:hypothetical protein MUP79_08240 [Candidatus Bathyarchaeota archaeon]|nr:hypothetical protein [Candidatus Bathyarchaeota archaeon]
MADSNDLLLLGVGILIGLSIVTVFILIQRQAPVTQPLYVEVPKSIMRQV